MQDYKIEIFRYGENGSPPGNIPEETFYTADRENARLIWQKYNAMKYENGMRTYLVKVKVLAYKNISDISSYFEQYEL